MHLEGIGVYCSKSNECDIKSCPKHLNGFNALYLITKEFKCEEYVTGTDRTRKENDSMLHRCL